MILLFDLLLVPRRGGESIEIKEREIGNEWRSIGETGQFLEEDKQLTVEFSPLFPKQLGSLVPSAEGFNVTLLESTISETTWFGRSSIDTCDRFYAKIRRISKL